MIFPAILDFGAQLVANKRLAAMRDEMRLKMFSVFASGFFGVLLTCVFVSGFG